jgi:hypothetical protein
MDWNGMEWNESNPPFPCMKSLRYCLDPPCFGTSHLQFMLEICVCIFRAALLQPTSQSRIFLASGPLPPWVRKTFWSSCFGRTTSQVYGHIRSLKSLLRLYGHIRCLQCLLKVYGHVRILVCLLIMGSLYSTP